MNDDHFLCISLVGKMSLHLMQVLIERRWARVFTKDMLFFSFEIVNIYDFHCKFVGMLRNDFFSAGVSIWKFVKDRFSYMGKWMVTFRELFSLEEILFVENVMDMKNKKKRSCASLLTVNVCKTFEVFSVNISFCTHIIIKP